MHLFGSGRRILAALLTATIVVATTSSGALAIQAEEAAPDTENMSVASSGSTTVLGIDLGSLLKLRLLGEDGLAGLDDVNDLNEALTRLVPLEISSATLPLLNAVNVPAVQARSTGGEDRTETQAVNIGNTLPVPGLLGGTIDPASLLALVNDADAQGLLTASVTNLKALAGLVGIDNILVDLGSTASASDATADRSVAIGQVSALDLTGLLQLLGLDLTDLSLEQLLGLGGQLGLLDGVLGSLGLSPGTLTALLGGIADLGDPGAAITTVTSAISSAVGSIDEQVVALCDELLGGLPLPLPVSCNSLETVTELVDQLEAQLDGIVALVNQLLDVVDGLLGVLDGAPLLTFGGLDAGVVATAARTVEDSVAAVDATVGDIFVAGQVLPGLDVGATLAQVNALANQVTGALDDVLGIVGLDGILDVGVLETTTSVDEADGVITALAELTGLRITITPPNLCDLLSGIDPTGTVGGLFEGLDGVLEGLALPHLGLPVGDLLGDLDSVINCSNVQGVTGAQVGDIVNALTQPLTIQAATISETSALSVDGSALPSPKPGTPAAPGTPTEKNLPRTGGSSPYLPLVAVMLAAAFGLRYMVRRES